MKGEKFLKITGILMIIGGGLSIILSLAAIVGVSALASMLKEMGGAEGTGMLYAAAILALVGGVIQLIAGILGVKHCKNPAKAQTCIIWGGLVAALSILGTILNVSGGKGISWSSLLLGLVLPVLYIYGAIQNKKSAVTM